MKAYFCCGGCTTSRIEAKHRIYKKYLNSSKRIIEVFQMFKNLESKEIYNFKDEIKKIPKTDDKSLDKCKIIKYFKEHFSNYAILKIKEELINSTNYAIEKGKRNVWYVFNFKN